MSDLKKHIVVVLDLEEDKISDEVRNFCRVRDLDLSAFISYAVSSDTDSINPPCRKLHDFLRSYSPYTYGLIDNLSKSKKSNSQKES